MDKPTEQLKYSILEPNEDQSKSVILKEGMNSTFTIQDFANNRVSLLKKKQELEAETSVNEAAKQNIIGTHPQVKDMDEKWLIAAAAYYQFNERVKKNLTTLQQIDDILKIETDELVEIAKQTGLQTQITNDKGIEVFTAALTNDNAKL